MMNKHSFEQPASVQIRPLHIFFGSSLYYFIIISDNLNTQYVHLKFLTLMRIGGLYSGKADNLISVSEHRISLRSNASENRNSLYDTT